MLLFDGEETYLNFQNFGKGIKGIYEFASLILCPLNLGKLVLEKCRNWDRIQFTYLIQNGPYAFLCKEYQIWQVACLKKAEGKSPVNNLDDQKKAQVFC